MHASCWVQGKGRSDAPTTQIHAFEMEIYYAFPDLHRLLKRRHDLIGDPGVILPRLDAPELTHRGLGRFRVQIEHDDGSPFSSTGKRHGSPDAAAGASNDADVVR
jgi:hypothetical protein